jgi:CRP-like cAMP-binding protein
VARSAAVDADRIAVFPIFADLPEAELDALTATMTEVSFDAGTEVVTLDDYGGGVYFIEQGEATVVDDVGERRAIGRGDAFGEIALLLTGQRTATVVASTPLRALSLSSQDFDHIRARVPELERSLRRLSLERAGR